MDEPSTNWDEQVEKARQGDPYARDRVLSRLRPLVVKRIQRRLGAGNSDASDVAQETLMNVDRSLHQFNGQGWKGFMAWARTIEFNAFARLNRRTVLPINSLDAAAGSSVALVDLLFADSPSPSSKAARAELELRLVSYISELSDLQRSVISMHYREKLSLREIGRRLRIGPYRATEAHRVALETLKRRLADGQ
jgi:RNA polymerase sigma factor (sigma-70 family)